MSKLRRVAEVVYCEEQKIQRGTEREDLDRHLDLLDLMSQSLCPTIFFLAASTSKKKKKKIWNLLDYWLFLVCNLHTHAYAHTQ